jgi:hypothetical protein
MEAIQFRMVQRGLIMKMDRGMEWTGKISSLQVAKRNGWTFARTARQALRDINAIASASEMPVMWSERFGDESDQPLTIAIAE